MDKTKQNKILIFDKLFTNNQICMMKIMLPYFPIEIQKVIAVYIKFIELNYTIEYLQKNSIPYQESFSEDDLYNELSPFCTKEEKTHLDKIQNLSRTMAQFKNIMDITQLMSELSPDNLPFSFDEKNSFDFNMFSQMMEMFEAEKENETK